MWDVAVVGGGPVGLFLAGELRRGGVSVVVFERKSPDAAGSEDGGDRGLQARTLQLLRLRGLLDAVRTRAAAEDGPGIADFTGAPGDTAPPEIAELVENWGRSRRRMWLLAVIHGHQAYLDSYRPPTWTVAGTRELSHQPHATCQAEFNAWRRKS